MTNTQEKHVDPIIPIAASVTGVVIGAGIGAAGAILLKNEKNRDKVQDVLNSLKDQVTDYSNKMKKKAISKKREVEQSISDSELKPIEVTVTS